MALEVQIIDSTGTGKGLKINSENEIPVVVHTHPPLDEEQETYPFRQFMKTSAGSSDMIVDGSSTAVDFMIDAVGDRDIFIKTVSFRIGDANCTLDKFGALTALTTGCAMYYQNDALGAITIADSLKTNLDLIRLGVSTQGIGTGSSAYILDVAGGNTEDTYLPVINFTEVFGLPWGLRLKKGSRDKLYFRVNDALAGLVTFNAIAYGVQI